MGGKKRSTAKHKNQTIKIYQPPKEEIDLTEQNQNVLKLKDLVLRSFEELEDKTKIIIDKSKPIGTGGFAEVFRGEKNKIVYAIKLIPINEKSKLPIEKMEEFSKNEMLIMINLKHKNCIKCFGTFSLNTGYKAIIMEYAVNCDLDFLFSLFWKGKLFKLFVSKKKENDEKNNNWLYHPSEFFIKFFINQIINGMDYLFQMNLTHLDLTPKNCLLTRSFTVKLTDFFLSKQINNAKDSSFVLPSCGNSKYMAPEYRLYGTVDQENAPKIDSFSLGVMIFHFLTNKFLCDDNGKNCEKIEEYHKMYFQDDENFRNFKKEYSLSNKLNDGICYLMKYLLFPDIKRRIAIKTLKEKPRELSNEEPNSLNNSINHKEDKEINIAKIWLNEYLDSIKFYYLLHENDYIKFLLELHKFDHCNFFKNRLDEKKFFQINEEEEYLIFDDEFLEMEDNNDLSHSENEEDNREEQEGEEENEEEEEEEEKKKQEQEQKEQQKGQQEQQQLQQDFITDEGFVTLNVKSKNEEELQQQDFITDGGLNPLNVKSTNKEELTTKKRNIEVL